MGIVSFDAYGNRTWGGRTYEDIIASLKRPRQTSDGDSAGNWAGTLVEGYREGVWSYTISCPTERWKQYELSFAKDRPLGSVSEFDKQGKIVSKHEPFEVELVAAFIRNERFKANFEHRLHAITLILTHLRSDEDIVATVEVLKRDIHPGLTFHIMHLAEALNLSDRDAFDLYIRAIGMK